ncbi:uncharacterized protein LOC113311968 [Papaver somniferum]|uniref:uncharacterized protein LOC113311968 n=1 Tax=Papaver somniferum TaxID=3469 RepID=UPI000E6FC2CD|nr:uncharacterized protein LOC113311968 [Papaver somniferum]
MNDWWVKNIWGNDQFKWRDIPSQGLSGDYPCTYWERWEFWIELEDLIGWATNHWVITGDFNAIRRRRERNKPGGSSRNSRLFNEYMEEHGLIDLPLNGGQFTWSNMQADPLLCRLDRILVTPQFEGKFPLLTQTFLSRTLSDHSPLLLTTSNINRNKPLFRVESFWFSHPEFLSNLQLWWNALSFTGSPSYILSKKLQNFKFFLKRWSRETYGQVETNKEELTRSINAHNMLEENSVLSDQQFSERAEWRASLKQINLDNARKWLTRAKTKHFKEGDANTKYFHTLENGRRRRRNTIQKIVMEKTILIKIISKKNYQIIS